VSLATSPWCSPPARVDGKDRGLNALGHEGLLKRAVGGTGLVPKVARLAIEGKIEAYNLPQGIISHLYRDIAAGKPAPCRTLASHIRRPPLGRRKDQRIDYRRPRARPAHRGKEWLLYKSFPIQVALLRGTTADPNGNVTAEREALDLDNLAMAMGCQEFWRHRYCPGRACDAPGFAKSASSTHSGGTGRLHRCVAV